MYLSIAVSIAVPPMQLHKRKVKIWNTKSFLHPHWLPTENQDKKRQIRMCNLKMPQQDDTQLTPSLRFH